MDLSVTEEVVEEEVDGLSLVPWELVVRPEVVEEVGLAVDEPFIFLVYFLLFNFIYLIIGKFMKQGFL